jgi:hypothetical protein
MRGQADALGLAIIDTTGRSETECVAELRQYAEELFAH